MISNFIPIANRRSKDVKESLVRFSDLSPSAAPSLDQQRDALRKGLGRSMQWALLGQLDDEPLLAACLKDQRFDMDVADTRGMWLWKMIQAVGAIERFGMPILDAMRDFADERSAMQICQLARHFSETGDTTFRTRLYEIVKQKPIPDFPCLGEEEILALDGIEAFHLVARLRGQELMTRDWAWHDDRIMDIAIGRCGVDPISQSLSDSPDEALCSFQRAWVQQQTQSERKGMASDLDPLAAITASDVISAAHSDDRRFRRFRGWGMKADQRELETVLQHLWTTQQAGAIANLLSVFSNRALPQFDARLIEFCEHENAEVRRRAFGALAMNTHSLIRRFALKQLDRSVSDGAVVSLFANNYESGDEHRILESLELPLDEGDRHSLLMDVNTVLEENPGADCSRLAVIVYASTPCENCRFFAVRLLHARQGMPDWMRDECRYDSGEDCRQFVGSATDTPRTYCLKLKTGRHFTLVGDLITIGRISFDSDAKKTAFDVMKEYPRLEGDCLCLSDMCVSRKHATLTRASDGTYVIADAESRCGTFVNDHQIKDATRLEPGDRIQIGMLRMEYCELSIQDAKFPWFNLGSD